MAARTANAPVEPAASGMSTIPFPLAVAASTKNPVGLALGVGEAVGLALGVGEAVGLALGVGEAVGLTRGVGEAVGLALGVGEIVGLALGVGEAVGLAVGSGVGVASIEVVLNSASSYVLPATRVSGTFGGGQVKIVPPIGRTNTWAGPVISVQPAVGLFGSAGLLGS